MTNASNVTIDFTTVAVLPSTSILIQRIPVGRMTNASNAIDQVNTIIGKSGAPGALEL
jgi:hypothetical protein